MSFTQDLKRALSQKWLREKLSLSERADLLCEITNALDWDTYQKIDEQGNYVKDIEKAMSFLGQDKAHNAGD